MLAAMKVSRRPSLGAADPFLNPLHKGTGAVTRPGGDLQCANERLLAS
jgi:hypothetical protein